MTELTKAALMVTQKRLFHSQEVFVTAIVVLLSLLHHLTKLA